MRTLRAGVGYSSQGGGLIALYSTKLEGDGSEDDGFYRFQEPLVPERSTRIAKTGRYLADGLVCC